jgi:hypothetical protein
VDQAAEDHGGTGRATPVSAEGGPEAELLPASQAPHTTVAPGWRWLQTSAALSPGWQEQPARMAAWARRTVIGWLVYSILERQERRSLGSQAQHVPGNQGAPASPTAAVGWALCDQVALGQGWVSEQEGMQRYGVQPHHLLLCDALGLDHAW